MDWFVGVRETQCGVRSGRYVPSALHASPVLSSVEPDDLREIDYAVLAMVGLNGQTAYELSLFSKDGKWGLLGYSRSSLHAIPKRLAGKGYLTSTVEAAEKSGSRRRYHLTDKGHRAVRDWLASGPSLAPVDSELVARVLAGETHQPIEDLLGKLLELRRDVERRNAELKLAELGKPHLDIWQRLAFGYHRHVVEAHARWLGDVERELKQLRRRKRQ